MYSFYYMCEWFCLHVCLCAMHVLGALGDQKRALNPLELEEWVLVNQKDAGNQTGTLKC